MRNRRLLLALLAGLALCWIALPPQETTADDASDRIERLVKQLGANKYADRERAQRELRAAGTPALGALKKAANDDGELGRRARELVAELEQKAQVERVLAPKKVHLTFKDTPVIDAVDELVRQSGYNIQIQGEVAALIKRKVTLDTGATTFWQAFDQLCAKAGLVEIAAQAPAANRFQADPRLNPGPFKMRPLPLQPFPVPRLPGPRNKGQMIPGLLQVGLPGADIGAKGLGPALLAVQGPFPLPGGGLDDDEQLKQLQKLLDQQMEQMLQRVQKQLQQMQQLRPGQRIPAQQQQMLQQMLQQFRQLRQFQQFPPMQGRPLPGLGGRFGAGQEPVEQELRAIHVKDGTPQPVPTAYAGALRIRLLPTERGRRDEVSLVIDVSVEPSVPGFSVGEGSRILRAIDERGQEVKASVVNRVQAVRGLRGVVSVPEPVLYFRLGEKEVKQVKELRGQLKGHALTRTDPLIVVNDIFNAVGKTFKGTNGGSIEIFAVEKKGDGEVQVQLRLESPPPQASGARAASLPALLDAKGESYQVVQVPSRGRRTNGRVVTQELTMLFRANPGQADPTRLVLNGVRSVAVDVPFQIDHVMLPEVRGR